ncbi:MAG: hypothetical protein P8N31_03405 [Planctomycetota bacterium]|nr:hypothetical protein [Planctomycetota bacterium]MDG2142579.1 hypothetical protein [Planctomycetota bacterium]
MPSAPNSKPSDAQAADLALTRGDHAATPVDLELAEFVGLDPELLEQLPAFETFFKTFGFKRVHGRVWGLLVLAGKPLSSKEISAAIQISTGATSTTINELTEWGALQSTFDPARRCHLHSVVGNTLSIVATILRRREQVAMAHFKRAAGQTLAYIKKKHGAADPRVLTLRSIIGSCEIAEAVMQLVMGSVERALGDSQSLLSKALTKALVLSTNLPGLGRGKKSTDTEHAPELPAAIEEYIEVALGSSAKKDAPEQAAKEATEEQNHG